MRVGESPFGGIYLKRRHAKVHIQDIGVDPFILQGLQRLAELGRDEAGLAGNLRPELLEALPGNWIAVDCYQRAVRADPLGDQPGVPSPAKGAVDHGVTG